MNRLSFQTQLTSIMEVLANAAVAEICRLVDDELAVVSVQMSRYQRENRLLKRRMHLLELKTARNTAERRLRETSGRGQIPLRAGIREPEPAGGVFEPQVDVSLWAGRPAGEDASSPPMESSDVELVDPEVKEEEETKVPQDKQIAPSADEGELKLVPRGAAGHGSGLEDQGSQFSSTQPQIQKQSEISSGFEGDEDEDVVLVKVEHVEHVVETSHHSDLSIQEGLVESSTEDYRRAPPTEDTLQSSRTHLSDLQDYERGFSESAAPHRTPPAPEETSSVVVVHLRIPDTKTADNLQIQQPGTTDSSALSSEYSLVELETLFTCWTPDGDSGTPTETPQSRFICEASADLKQDDGVPMKTEPVPRRSKGFGLSSVAGSLDSPGPSLMAGAPWRKPLSRTTVSCEGDIRILQGQSSVSSAEKTQSSCLAIAEVSGSGSPNRTNVGPSNSFPGTGSTGSDSVVGSTAHHQHLMPRGVAFERRKRSYICPTCGKAFSGLSNLEAHERVHTGEKPFTCNTCGKCFSEAGNLKKHQRVHTGEKPYSCHFCGRTFAWICNLRTHLQSATGCGPQSRGTSGAGQSGVG